MKKVVISQPRYLPALNYLQRLKCADIFVFLDNVQIQRRGWENRNRILLNGKERWLTIPISSGSRCLIKYSIIAGIEWIEEHKRLLKQAYFKSPYFSEEIIEKYYEGIYEVIESTNFNYRDVLIKLVLNACEIFSFRPRIELSSNLVDDDIKGPMKLFEVCKKLDASIYVSGPNGKNYGVEEVFKGSGIVVKYHYFNYPVYKQFNSRNFIPWLSFFDSLFNLGLDKVKEIVYSPWRLEDE